MKIGFIGLGIMGNFMALNLLKNGVELNVYNRTKEKAKEHIEKGALFLNSPKEIAEKSDIIILMLSNSKAVSSITEGNGGLLNGLHEKKIVINMSTIEPDYSCELHERVKSKSSLFLEAPVIGSKIPAKEASLIILAAGDKEAFDASDKYFNMIGKKIEYLGDVPKASYLKIINNQIMGITMGALAEGFALADKIGLDKNIIYDIVNSGAFANPMFQLKGKNIINNDYETNFPYKHMQKDLGFAVKLSEEFKTFCPLTCTIDNSYILGYKKFKDEDMCAIYKSLS
ncbi:MAG: NAD(P)-dependent oxidoreductase [Candidatus Acididesulfobacter diazotrophicus]|uniref:NAD(P)-dependent oxidoreductase n=1 Tax=Candidatus Acididesulfobacter diazotrophicus TaxID=2597226 RepID=A0A519BKQ1_9DELT|nr:MAG: NAD(P)-dependent oxidoreductase [Candidatus Acididesulfobacter diazotrophicus]